MANTPAGLDYQKMPIMRAGGLNASFFDVGIVVKNNRSKLCLAWSVLLWTTISVLSMFKTLWTQEAQPIEFTFDLLISL